MRVFGKRKENKATGLEKFVEGYEYTIEYLCSRRRTFGKDV